MMHDSALFIALSSTAAFLTLAHWSPACCFSNRSLHQHLHNAPAAERSGSSRAERKAFNLIEGGWERLSRRRAIVSDDRRIWLNILLKNCLTCHNPTLFIFGVSYFCHLRLDSARVCRTFPTFLPMPK